MLYSKSRRTERSVGLTASDRFCQLSISHHTWLHFTSADLGILRGWIFWKFQKQTVMWLGPTSYLIELIGNTEKQVSNVILLCAYCTTKLWQIAQCMSCTRLYKGCVVKMSDQLINVSHFVLVFAMQQWSIGKELLSWNNEDTNFMWKLRIRINQKSLSHNWAAPSNLNI